MSTITRTNRRSVEPHKLTRAAEKTIRDAVEALLNVAMESEEGTAIGAESLDCASMLSGHLSEHSQK